MSIQVIGAGLGRTGTLSLKAALEELGFGKCYHMTEVLAHLDDVRIWDAAVRGEPVDWDKLFAGYRATVDVPSSLFYRELMAKYPAAKVILTVRDAERWYDSTQQTIYFAKSAFPKWAAVLNPRMGGFQRMLDRLWERMFQNRFEDRAFAIDVFNRHNEQVRRDVPAERLLVYEVNQGWGPLCAFLGVPVPEGKPFPHVNDTAEFRGRIERGARIVRTIGYAALGAAALVLVLLALVAVRWWRGRNATPASLQGANPATEAESDPRLAYNGPFRNIDPAVHYVGDAQCAACHEDKARTYHQHAMGRSFLSESLRTSSLTTSNTTIPSALSARASASSTRATASGTCAPCREELNRSPR